MSVRDVFIDFHQEGICLLQRDLFSKIVKSHNHKYLLKANSWQTHNKCLLKVNSWQSQSTKQALNLSILVTPVQILSFRKRYNKAVTWIHIWPKIDSLFWKKQINSWSCFSPLSLALSFSSFPSRPEKWMSILFWI